MKLSNWIVKCGGDEKAGKRVGVKRNCVYAWRTGAALPRPETMKLIVSKTGGRVSYGEMVDEYLAKRALLVGKSLRKKLGVKIKTVKAVGAGKRKPKRSVKLRKSLAKKKKVDLGF